MGDNFTRYRAIKQTLSQLFRGASGRQTQYLEVLTALISGIVGSQRTNLGAIAAKIPGQNRNKVESRIKQYSRWLQKDKIVPSVYFAPFARLLLQSLSHAPLVLVIDGSVVGQGCMALMLSVVYHGRALPLGWLVVQAKKGHLAQAKHLELLEQVKPLVPTTSEVIFLGDGEFDGCDLLARLHAYGWHYVCRTAKNSRLSFGDDACNFAQLALEPGDLVVLDDTTFSLSGYGPIQAIAVWDSRYQEPLYLVSDLELAEQAVYYYKKRFHIETFFSDLKSRGFAIDRSHMREPARLARLLLAACIAYLWLVHLGTVALSEGWHKLIHRTDRCDLSLFALGLRLLDYFLNEGLPLPVAFIPILLEEF